MGCFVEFRAGGFFVAEGMDLYWTNPNCTGTPYTQIQQQGTNYYPSPVACFTGYGYNTAGTYKLRQPVQTVPVQVWSWTQYSQGLFSNCQALSSGPTINLYPIDSVTWAQVPASYTFGPQ